MSEPAIALAALGKCYPLYNRPTDRILDAFALLPFFPWREKSVRAFWALRGMTLSIRKGERVGLIGRNGAGKSTLLKLVCGIVQPTEGSLVVNGSIQALMEIGTAFHPEFTGRENIRASLAYQGYSSHEAGEYEEDIEDFVELGSFMDQPVKAYSAGMYARLAFAVSTAIRPDILIVDEILGAGDAYFARKCADRMKRLTHDSGATLLFVSHDISSVQQMCDRAIWIERGQIVMDGAPLDVGKAYYAETLRLEEERLIRHNQRGLGSTHETQPDVMVFRFIREDGGALRQSHLIRRLTLNSAHASCQLNVLVGAPMDNDQSQSASIITRPGALWGEAVFSENSGYARPIMATAGGYQAAFQFVNIGLTDMDDLQLEVEHAASSEETLALEAWNGQNYVRLGLLTAIYAEGQWRIDRFAVRPQTGFTDTGAEHIEKAQDAPLEETSGILPQTANLPGFQRIRQTTDKFASTYVEIHEINICGENGPQAVFGLHETFILQCRLQIKIPLKIAWFTLAIYTQQDACVYVGHWGLGEDIEPGLFSFDISFAQPALRQGAYILSFAILENYHAKELVYFSEWNRTHHFRVNENYFGTVSLGAVEMLTFPPCSTRLSCKKEDSHV
jgi:lipopolysaccharide transport system ATP-binding protein